VGFSAVALRQEDFVYGLARRLGDYLAQLAVFVAAFLIAAQLRETLPFGKPLGDDYASHSPRSYLVLAVASLGAYVVRLTAERAGWSRSRLRFWAPVGGTVLAGLGLAWFRPDQSLLQTVYFVVATVVLIVLIVPLPTDADNEGDRPELVVSLGRLWNHRGLLFIWVRFNIRSRYDQTLLGVLWIALLPLSTALVLSVVFSKVMRVPVGDVPYTSFLLAGLVPWGLFSQAIGAGMRSILGAMGLINQIYFPREIIVFSALGEAMVDAAFMFVAMLVVNAALGVWPNPLYAVLPVLILIQVAFTLGLMLLASWLSIVVQITFYLCPVLYPVSIVPDKFRFLLAINPIAVLIEAYRDVIVYARPPEWTSLLYPAVLATGTLIFGYRLFKANEETLADFV